MADILDVDIHSLTPSGDGLGTCGTLAVTVPFTIPGERVRVELARRPPGGAASGRLLDVLRASRHRVAAPCRHFGPSGSPLPCGGCSWQHIAYPEQLRLKSALVQRLVEDALQRRPPIVRPTLPATPIDDPWHYRQKVHFVFGSDARGDLVMGHYARGSRRVLPIAECPVHDPNGNALAFRMLHAFERSGINADAGGRRPGSLRHLAVRVGAHTAEMMATLVVSSDNDKRLRVATRRGIEGRSELTSFHLNVHPKEDAFIFGRETRRISGSERMREKVGGTSFLLSPTSFFQTNVQAAEILVGLVVDAIPPGARVLDLYAGAGLFALPLALGGHDVLAVEESRAAVDDGLASLRLNRLSSGSCRFIAGRVETALRAVTPAAATAVVLDPPRDGCAQGVLHDVFGRLKPGRAVYISCNPEALARDLALIEQSGYAPASLQPVDMFPHTAHIETVVVLEPANRRGRR